jgi:hypothetical protein
VAYPHAVPLCQAAITELLLHRPEACLVADARGDCPLHVALRRAAGLPCAAVLVVVAQLLQARPGAARLRGAGGQLPLHIAIASRPPRLHVRRVRGGGLVWSELRADITTRPVRHRRRCCRGCHVASGGGAWLGQHEKAPAPCPAPAAVREPAQELELFEAVAAVYPAAAVAADEQQQGKWAIHVAVERGSLETAERLLLREPAAGETKRPGAGCSYAVNRLRLHALHVFDFFFLTEPRVHSNSL